MRAASLALRNDRRNSLKFRNGCFGIHQTSSPLVLAVHGLLLVAADRSVVGVRSRVDEDESSSAGVEAKSPGAIVFDERAGEL